MQINQKLVEKFFSGQCTAAEARLVSKYLADENNREVYLNSEEWEHFEPVEKVDEKISDRIYVKVLDHIHDKRETRRIRFRYLAYAASIVLIATVGLVAYKLTNNRVAKPSYVASNRSKPVTRVETFITNTSAVKKNYTLPDGTIVELYPKSEVSYFPFDQGKRDVNLTGQALFRVHKDKTKPFTVFANNLATTALGTVFKITAFKKGLYTKVRLIEGKVMVKPLSKLLSAGVETVYLLPGKVFTVNMQTYAASVKPFNVEAPKQLETLDPGKAIVTEAAIVFDNEPLSGVFNALETKLNIKINFTPSELIKMEFTGQYEFGRDDIDGFLKMIGSLNNLTVDKTDVGYTIKKIK
ncbi:FecR family protein [Pedobacter zeae]|uniref:Anti-sigma factor n=1 Tax=Pedobacter zeae TaxID=1737356 RepID=A0A7W6KCZ0_9SPHI|nr:FecR domain-containing protein [Pedobacter zeae]MBB4109511.1 ferric-dicitrate binding protein FerR (iron transport regulator) [Pedobacter zeae]GGH12654.1 anti-sigma factor [Pedobacter zeae]